MSFAAWRTLDLDEALASDPGPAIRSDAILHTTAGRIAIKGGWATPITGVGRVDDAGEVVGARGVGDTAKRVADPPRKADIQPMTDAVTRDEMSARLEAVESRLESRIVQVSADVRVLVDKIDALTASVAEGRNEGRSSFHWIVGIVVAVGIAVVGFVYSIGGMLSASQSSIISAFQTGIAAKPSEPATPPTIIVNVPPMAQPSPTPPKE